MKESARVRVRCYACVFVCCVPETCSQPATGLELLVSAPKPRHVDPATRIHGNVAQLD